MEKYQNQNFLTSLKSHPKWQKSDKMGKISKSKFPKIVKKSSKMTNHIKWEKSQNQNFLKSLKSHSKSQKSDKMEKTETCWTCERIQVGLLLGCRRPNMWCLTSPPIKGPSCNGLMMGGRRYGRPFDARATSDGLSKRDPLQRPHPMISPSKCLSNCIRPLTCQRDLRPHGRHWPRVGTIMIPLCIV